MRPIASGLAASERTSRVFEAEDGLDARAQTLPELKSEDVDTEVGLASSGMHGSWTPNKDLVGVVESDSIECTQIHRFHRVPHYQ